MNSLDAKLLNAVCARDGLPWRVEVASEVTSTSDLLRLAAQAGEAEGRVLFAEAQTQGRGRRDSLWITPPGKDLMFSLLLRPAVPVARWPRITTLAALAVCRAIEQEFPLVPQVKWPNDIYIGDRKVGGLLAEVAMGKNGMALVLGIGLNVNTQEFPAELAGQATSLLRELSTPVPYLDRQRLAQVLLAELHSQLQRLDDSFSDAVAEVRARSWLLGRQIRATVDGHEIYGRALDLDTEGHLVLALPDGSTTHLTSADGVRKVM
ncbi:MAG: biotin--[acetyl-CoA-carboxylase] ligase [Prosthecobacter sp.]|nr:biotin--[acetyl-CoA-carboxylase] ligase [Prosthecobacter sp.]